MFRTFTGVQFPVTIHHSGMTKTVHTEERLQQVFFNLLFDGGFEGATDATGKVIQIKFLVGHKA